MHGSPQMRDELPEWVRAWLSVPRLAPYVAAAGPFRALELYAWNSTASSVLFELIGWFEVAWRNNIDRAICAGRGATAGHWLFDKAFPLQPRTWVKVGEAARIVRRRVHEPTPGQIIAELTLGFWRFTASGYRQTIWMSYLSHAFPHGLPARARAATRSAAGSATGPDHQAAEPDRAPRADRAAGARARDGRGHADDRTLDQSTHGCVVAATHASDANPRKPALTCGSTVGRWRDVS
jgi:hypothetical protein